MSLSQMARSGSSNGLGIGGRLAHGCFKLAGGGGIGTLTCVREQADKIRRHGALHRNLDIAVYLPNRVAALNGCWRLHGTELLELLGCASDDALHVLFLLVASGNGGQCVAVCLPVAHGPTREQPEQKRPCGCVEPD